MDALTAIENKLTIKKEAYPLTTKKQLCEGLHRLGVQPGDVLLVHSAMKPLGPVEDGCRGVIEALLEALTDTGTLLLPALTYATVTRENPVFSVSDTPSCVGKLSEAFRTMPGVRRSVHPTHSVCAVGRLAAEMLSGHEDDRTPVGPHSPFRRLAEQGGKILMLGCGLTPNTFMHGVEEEAGVPYCLSPDPIAYTCILPDGTRYTATYTPHLFDGITQRYDRAAALLDGDALRFGRVALADCALIDAAKLRRAALARMQTEPLYFVDRNG